jgi:hypothetical protein
MDKGRLEGFSDGVLATIITIMVLDTKAPEGFDLRAIHAALPAFLVYALNYLNVGIVWNNHHHILHATGKDQWPDHVAQSFPAVLGFTHPASDSLDERDSLRDPADSRIWRRARDGHDCLRHIRESHHRFNGSDSKLAAAIGTEWKGLSTLGIYLVGIFVAFVSPALAIALYVAVPYSGFFVTVELSGYSRVVDLIPVLFAWTYSSRGEATGFSSLTIAEVHLAIPLGMSILLPSHPAYSLRSI